MRDCGAFVKQFIFRALIDGQLQGTIIPCSDKREIAAARSDSSIVKPIPMALDIRSEKVSVSVLPPFAQTVSGRRW